MHTFYLHDSFVSVDEKLDSLQEKIQNLEDYIRAEKDT